MTKYVVYNTYSARSKTVRAKNLKSAIETCRPYLRNKRGTIRAYRVK